MGPAPLATASPLLARPLTIGCSTGYMTEAHGNWSALVEQAAATSSFAVELSAISEPELPGLLAYLAEAPSLPFHFVSVHAPSKQRTLREEALVAQLARLPAWIDAVVVHPDVIDDVGVYRRLGRALVLENMDTRKASGQTAEQLAVLFSELPNAGLCFDVAHAGAVDHSLEGGMEILNRFGNRLRHVHISSLDDDLHHVPLTIEDEERFARVLDRCSDVPWILEAPPIPS
jgi:Xylose isomerase-like TIM barrel